LYLLNNTYPRFMKHSVLFLLFVFLANGLQAQFTNGIHVPNSTIQIISDYADPSVKYAEGITSENLYSHLSVLASDEYEGRETGQAGNNKAAKYIANHFQKLGLKATGPENSFYQKVAFTFTSWKETKMSINGKDYKHLWDFLAIPTLNENIDDFNFDEVVYLGFGIADKNYNNYDQDVKGKVIMIYRGEPIDKKGRSKVTKSNQLSDWNIDKKLAYAKSKGVKMVLIIESDLKKLLGENRRRILGGDMELGDMTKHEFETANHVYISSSMAKDIMGKKTKKVIKSRDKSKKKGKVCNVDLETDVNCSFLKEQSVIFSQNVLGYLEGTDKKDELVVVSAHYDHLGKKGKDIFNGADDNGTGTSTVLQLAESFVDAKSDGKGPRRSILFLLATGEEKGLLGSQYYAANPVFPLKSTIANVNVDMIGRVDDKHKDEPNYIYVIGSDRLSSDLHNINEEINQKYTQLILDYTYNDVNDPNRYYERSDHYSFAKNGIPAIFYFSGVHEDYHRPSDTVEKIMFDKMAKIGKHIFHTTWELANRTDRIVVDGKVE